MRARDAGCHLKSRSGCRRGFPLRRCGSCPRSTTTGFTAQVHAVRQEYHDSVNAILTPHQLELMKAMVARLDSGKEERHTP
jgi:hypothetical protein